jgi:hypothetical protein
MLPRNLYAVPGILVGVRSVWIRTMPTSECYRRQAEICAQIASISSDPTVIARCASMVEEHLARAAALDVGPDSQMRLPVLGGGEGRDMDRGD